MPKIDNATENVQAMLKSGGVVEQMYDRVKALENTVYDESTGLEKMRNQVTTLENQVNNEQTGLATTRNSVVQNKEDIDKLEELVYDQDTGIKGINVNIVSLKSITKENYNSILETNSRISKSLSYQEDKPYIDTNTGNFGNKDNDAPITHWYKEKSKEDDYCVYLSAQGNSGKEKALFNLNAQGEIVVDHYYYSEEESKEVDENYILASVPRVEKVQEEVEKVQEEVEKVQEEVEKVSIPESFKLQDNVTYGKSQTAVGSGTSAGITGFYLCPGTINQTEGSFQLTDTQGSTTPLTGSHYGTLFQGLKSPLSINCGNKYQNYFTIKEVKFINDSFAFKIYVNEPLPFSEAETGDLHPMDNAVYCIDVPDIGPVHFDSTAFAAGDNTRAIERGSFAEGRDTLARGQYSHAEGRKTEAAYAAHAEGYKSVASYEYSHAEGYSSVATNHSAHAEGNATTASGQYGSHAEGNGAKAIGESSHAEGSRTEASGISAHAEGGSTKAQGIFSHSEGEGTVASEPHSHAEGHGSTAKADSAHAEGYYSKALNLHSHAEGNSSEATGESSHAEGYYAKAKGNRSHAEGSQTQANGSSSHAEGSGAIANAGNSHAEGYESQATGEASHSEGYRTTSGGQGSHSEGRQTIASGAYTHAEGYLAQAKSTGSHAEGIGTIANEECQHVEGKYNAPAGSTVHVVGWGTSDTDRKNIHTLSREGNAWYAGSVTSKDGKLASEDYVNTKVSDLMGSAPELLDTLSELSAALGNDPDFSATVVDMIAQKADAKDVGVVSQIQIPDTNNTVDAINAVYSDIRSHLGDYRHWGSIVDERLDELELASSEIPNIEKNSKDYIDTKIADLVNSAPETLDTLGEIAEALDNDASAVGKILTDIGNLHNEIHAGVYPRIEVCEQKLNDLQQEIVNIKDKLSKFDTDISFLQDKTDLISPDGTRFKLVVADDGSLSTVQA